MSGHASIPSNHRREETITTLPPSPYFCPSAFLPVSSDWSAISLDSVRLNHQAHMTLRAAVNDALQAATEIINVTQHHVIPVAQLGTHLEYLRQRIRKIYLLLRPEIGLLETKYNLERGEMVLESAGYHANPEELLGYVNYDRYFKQFRVISITSYQFLAQVAATTQSVLLDLPFTILNIEEILNIIQAIKMMFELITHDFFQDGDQDTIVHTSSGLLQKSNGYQPRWLDAWQSPKIDPPEWNCKVAKYRWRVGHHFFNTCAIFCREWLLRANLAIESGDDDRAAELLNIASIFLRATSAATHYAGNFPATTYEQYTRQSMINMKSPNGFSGDQNLDYKRMKQAKDQLRSLVQNNKDRLLANTSALIYEALLQFREVYIEDMERHVLMAAAKVKLDTSLTQKVYQDALPPGMRLKSALDILRDMTNARRKEFVL